MAYKIPRLKPPPTKETQSLPENRPTTQKTAPKAALPAFAAKKTAPIPVSVARTPKVGLPGVSGPGPLLGKTLLSCVKEELDSASDELSKDGFYLTKRQAVATSLVRMAMMGSFAHQKEILDRENGKVPDRVAGADGEELKLYIGMPLDGPNAP